MRIKQQKQIKAFLMEEFGAGPGGALLAAQEKALIKLIAGATGKTKNQMKTLAQTILPRIALYQALLADSASQADAYARMRK